MNTCMCVCSYPDSDLWSMIYDLWSMIYDLWSMIYDLWSMIYDLWSMIYDLWSMIYDLWSMIYDLWSMIYDLWSMIYDLWSMIYDLWSMIYDLWSSIRLDFNTYSLDSGSYIQPNFGFEGLEAKVGFHIAANAVWKSRSCCKPYIYESGHANFTTSPMWVQAIISMSKYIALLHLFGGMQDCFSGESRNSLTSPLNRHPGWGFGHKQLVCLCLVYNKYALPRKGVGVEGGLCLLSVLKGWGSDYK